ncbi:MAG: endonuclease [Nitriliruptorales bacterium]|nr:endonuclease [Nitriliruptorales bacterium]
MPTFRRLFAVITAILLVLPASVASATTGSLNEDRQVTVMSRNLYLGASLEPLIAPPDDDVLEAVRLVWQQVQDTDFPQRAEALADEIVDNGPLLVGLQEVTTYRTGTVFSSEAAEHIVLDFLEILLAELAERGAHYRVIESVENFDGELPYVTGDPSTSFDLRLTDRDVIIARADVPTSQLKVLATDSGNFSTSLPLPIAGQTTPILRGWVSADVKHRGQTFRFVNTHPEAFHDGVNAAQIAELAAGPLSTPLPVVLVGDLNATPASDSMSLLHAAGFRDTAVTAATSDAGPTCCFDATLTGGALTTRIDYVLYRGAFDARTQRRVGHRVEDQTPGGLYPSDHAGVVARLILAPESED